MSASRRVALILVSGILVLAGLARQPGLAPAQPPEALKGRLQALANTAVAAGAPGVSIAVHHPRDGLILVTAGKSDLTAGTALTPTDVSRIASVSKVFVGVVVMQLVQEKKVALTDRIARYIAADHAAHIANANRATIRELLTHTSGIVDYYDDDFGADDPRKLDFTIDEALKYAWDKEADFATGARYSYSNTNTLLLAIMIEKVTGTTVAQAIRTRLLAPLNLTHTYTEVFERVPVKIVRGYVFDGPGRPKEIGNKYPGGGLPDGGLVTTPENMVRFLRALLVERTLLQPAVLQQMLTPAARRDEDDWAGSHIFVVTTAHGKKYIHNGAIAGYNAEMLHYPDAGVTMAYWINGSGGKADRAWENLDVEGIVFGPR
jgi:D-alanyl-D-alanine carboxypeptidase